METDWISINGQFWSKLIWENNYGFWVYIKPDFWWSGEQKWSGIDFIFIVYNKSNTVNQKFKASVGISRIFTNFKACPGSSNFFSQNLRLVPVKIDIFPEFTIIKGFLLWQKPLLVSEPPLKAVYFHIIAEIRRSVRLEVTPTRLTVRSIWPGGSS